MNVRDGTCTTYGRELFRLASVILCLLATLPPIVLADDDVQQWSSVRYVQPIDDRWDVNLSGRLRVDDNLTRRRDLLVRPSVDYRIARRLHISVGYDRLHTYPPDKNSEDRLWQQAVLKLKRGANSASQRLRIEQRWIDNVSGLVYRVRYRLRGEHTFDQTPWYIALSNELFHNLNSQGAGPPSGFEQYRVYGGVGHYLTDRLWIEAGYQWKNKHRRDDTDQSVHALMLTLTFRGRPRDK